MQMVKVLEKYSARHDLNCAWLLNISTFSLFPKHKIPDLIDGIKYFTNNEYTIRFPKDVIEHGLCPEKVHYEVTTKALYYLS